MTWEIYRDLIRRCALLLERKHEHITSDELTTLLREYNDVLKSNVQVRRGLISLGVFNDRLLDVVAYVPAGVYLKYESKEVGLDDVIHYDEHYVSRY